MDVHIPVSILSENQNNDRYTDPVRFISTQFVRSERAYKYTQWLQIYSFDWVLLKRNVMLPETEY